MQYSELVGSLAEPTTRLQVAAQLREALPDSCEALLQGLETGVPSVRRWFAVVLDHAPHDTRIEAALMKASTDRNRKVRRAALHALACAHCKPDGCLTTDGIGIMVDGLLHDRSLAVRRTCAGNMMYGQAGRSERILNAFRHVLANDSDDTLRKRAATYVAFEEVHREGRSHSEWVEELVERIADLAGV